jgi:5-methylcytosine-specific restriction endonuclease McrA
MAKKRDYKKEYARDHSSTKAKKTRALRNAANRALNPGPGKEVDHKKPLSKGGTNSKKNLRVVSRSANRKKGSKLITRKKRS